VSEEPRLPYEPPSVRVLKPGEWTPDQRRVVEGVRGSGNGKTEGYCPWCCDDRKHNRDGGDCNNCRGRYDGRIRACAKHVDRQDVADRINDHHDAVEEAVKPEDFYAYMPMHNYLHIPSGGEPWPAGSVDARIAPIRVGTKKVKQKVKDGDGGEREVERVVPNLVRASRWLDQNRHVEQMTWWPGRPQLIEDSVFAEGELLPHRGCHIFNLYRAPTITGGDPAGAERWVALVRRLYPGEADHMIAWFAHRVQRPHEKVNHALILGGPPGIGKDAILAPVRTAVGEWNFHSVSPSSVMEGFTWYVQAVVLRVDELRDLGDVSRYDFYERTKSLIASPPEVLTCNKKNIREYRVPNLLGVVMTTNHRLDGIYLPVDDRRHLVAWSEVQPGGMSREAWTEWWTWLQRDGRKDVAAYLREHDIASFDPKAPPPKTDVFYAVVSANSAPEDEEMGAAIEAIGAPGALIVRDLLQRNVDPEFKEWLQNRKNARSISHRLDEAGYVLVPNPDAPKDRRWRIMTDPKNPDSRRRSCPAAIYARKELSPRGRIVAATGRAGQQLDLDLPPGGERGRP